MEIAMIGLGRMGGNMVTRLLHGGHQVIAYARTAATVQEKVDEGAVGAHSLPEVMVKFTTKPRVIWVMVPSGDTTTQTIATLSDIAEPGDIIIDGGNTNWKLALGDAERVTARGMKYLDAGTSGGVWGVENGYCLMVGGDPAAYEHCLPLLKTLAPDGGGLVYTGPAGSGHFVKMVHNGIEYGMMQAYAEGFEIMQRSGKFPGLDLPAIAEAWRESSVVRSWLLDLISDGLHKDPQLAELKGWVEDTGEGRWTVEAALEESVPAGVIALSLFTRFRSREENTFADRMLAMMRNEFGGHAVVHADGAHPA